MYKDEEMFAFNEELQGKVHRYTGFVHRIECANVIR